MSLSKRNLSTIISPDEKPNHPFFIKPCFFTAADLVTKYNDNDYCIAAYNWCRKHKMTDEEYSKYTDTEKQSIYNFEMEYFIRRYHDEKLEFTYSLFGIYITLLHMTTTSRYYDENRIVSIVNRCNQILTTLNFCKGGGIFDLTILPCEQQYARKIFELVSYSGEIKQAFGDKFKEFEDSIRKFITSG